MKGKIVLEVLDDDSNLILHSSELIVYIDYEEAKAKYVLDPITLESNEPVSSWKFEDEPITFETNYNLGYIPTTYHEPKRFVAQIELSDGDEEVDVESKASLRYLYNKWYSGILTTHFNVSSDVLGLDRLVSPNSQVKVSISHLILPSES